MSPLQIAETLGRASSRTERARLVHHLASQLNLSPGSILRKAREAGHRANKQTRSDSGSTAITAAHLKTISGAVAKTQRLNKKIVAPVSGVVAMLQANGQLPALAPATFCRALRQARLSKAEIKSKPTYRNRSTEPGQVFMLDSSTSLYWRFPKGVEQPAAPLDATTQMRWHKPEIMAQVGNADTIKRYFVIDHCSGYAHGRYIYTRGETALDTISTLLAAFKAMGVPQKLYIDLGPGNVAFETKYLLWLLGVDVVQKSGKDEWTLGRIDNLHGQVQTGLEWRFSHAKPTSIAQMNDLMTAWLHHRNCVAVHRDANRTRHEMLLDAKPGVLRRLPPELDLEAAILSRPQTRRIDGRGIIQFASRYYQVDRAELYNSTQYIAVNPFAPDQLLVLEEFSLDTMQCVARHEAIEVRVNNFGQLENAVPLLGEHPVAAKRPSWSGEIAEAKKFATAQIAAHDLDPYADLRPGQVEKSKSPKVETAAKSQESDPCSSVFIRGKTSPEFSELQLARKLAAADPVAPAAQGPSFEPVAARFRVRHALRAAGISELPDLIESELAAWSGKDAIPSAEIAALIARATAPEPEHAQEKAG